MSKPIHIDLGYKPRPFQAVLHNRMKRFNMLVCHRRFGKTYFSLREMIDKALKNALRNPHYAYFAPTYKQAKMVAWEYLKDFLKPIPGVKINETDLRVTINRPAPYNDTITFYLAGAEDIDSHRGTYFDGVILDEYAQMNPEIWSKIIRPAISDRKGWVIFIGTPSGQNHFYDLYRQTRDHKDWFTTLLPATLTKVVDEEELQSARDTMSDEEFRQEYLCDFTAALTGAYYGKLIRNLETSGRISSVPHEPLLPVRTYWDLGLDDCTTVVFVQTLGRERRIIHYIERTGTSLPEVIKEVLELPYIYGAHVMPWDIEVRELTTGKTRLETVRPLLKNIQVGKKLPILDRINAVRNVLPSCWFNEATTLLLVDALKNYTKDWDAKKKLFSEKPKHDWTSHGADAFGYMALDNRVFDGIISESDFERSAHDADYDMFG